MIFSSEFETKVFTPILRTVGAALVNYLRSATLKNLHEVNSIQVMGHDVQRELRRFRLENPPEGEEGGAPELQFYKCTVCEAKWLRSEKNGVTWRLLSHPPHSTHCVGVVGPPSNVERFV